MIKKINFTLNQLIGSDFYLGYFKNNWNPMINYFLLGYYRNINIFNLNLTYNLLKISFNLLTNIILKKGNIWIINEKFLYFNKILDFLKLNNKFKNLLFFNNKWPKGLLSNYKKVIFIKDNKFPNIIFISNLEKNNYVVNESYILNIPTIGIIDSKDNPYNVLYPIPGNTKSLKAIYFIYLLLFKNIFYSSNLKKKKFKNVLKNKLLCLKLKYFNNSKLKQKYQNIFKFFYLKTFLFIYKLYFLIFIENKLNIINFYKRKFILNFLKKHKLINLYKKNYNNFLKNLKKKNKKLYNFNIYLKNYYNIFLFSIILKLKIKNLINNF